MFRLALRLAAGGREASTRLLVVAGSVMIGVAILFFAVSGLNLMYGSAKKVCWSCMSAEQFQQPLTADTGRYPLLWRDSTDYFGGKTITRYDVAVRGGNASTIPGVSRMPVAGEYYVSPALAELIRTRPANQLGDRFNGSQIGIIGAEGLSSPGELVAVVGHSSEELLTYPRVKAATGFNTAPQKYEYGSGVAAVLIATVAGLLFAVLTLIATSTRLAASRREEKFAGLRLAGATSSQIVRFAIIEAVLGSAAGVVAGGILFYVSRPLLADMFSTRVFPFFAQDLMPGLWGSIMIVAAIPVLAAIAAVVSLARLHISALGVVRKTASRTPRAWRILPIVAGIACLSVVWLRNLSVKEATVRAEMLPVFLLGFVLVIVGLVIAGPWLTLKVNDLIAKRVNSPAILLASRRLNSNAGAAFRPLSVLVVVVFLCTMISAIVPVFLEEYSNPYRQQATNILAVSQSELFTSRNYTFAEWSATGLAAQMQSVSGVHVAPVFIPADNGGSAGTSEVLIRCSDTQYFPVFGTCPQGVTALRFETGFEINTVMNSLDSKLPTHERIPESAFSGLRMYSVVIATDGNPAHIDQLRTVMAQHPVYISSGQTWGELSREQATRITGFRVLIDAGLLLVLFVAGCSLAVAAAGSLIERKRPFGLLRVSGMSVRTLVGVVLYETIVPLLAATVLAAGLALLTVHVLVGSLGTLPAPDVPPLSSSYYALLAAGLIVVLTIISSTLPILAAITKPSNVRFE